MDSGTQATGRGQLLGKGHRLCLGIPPLPCRLLSLPIRITRSHPEGRLRRGGDGYRAGREAGADVGSREVQDQHADSPGLG